MTFGVRVLLALFFSFVGPEEGGAIEAALDGRLVDNDTILLVISCEASHGYNGIGSYGHLEDRDVFRGFSGDEGSLGVVE